MISVNLPWKPRAKGRPRTTLVRGRLVTYTPKPTRDAELDLKEAWYAAVEDEPFEGPICVHLELTDNNVHLTIAPTAEPESRKMRGDLDNYVKLVLDALNGHAWVDDRQIVELHVVKR